MSTMSSLVRRTVSRPRTNSPISVQLLPVCPPAARRPAGEHLLGPGLELLLPGVDRGRVDAELGGQLVHRPVASYRRQGDLGLERRNVGLPLRRHRDRLRADLHDDPGVIEAPSSPLTPVPPLARRIDRHLSALTAYRGADETERLAVMRERGWREAVRHLVARGELTHAGRVEAGQLVVACEEWFREQRGEPAEGWGR